jgi:hypothetical protein
VKFERCNVHQQWPEGHPDRYYHAKLCNNLLDPLREIFTPDEIDVLMEGRRHADGRPGDEWAIGGVRTP